MSDGDGETGTWPSSELPTGWEWTKFAEIFDSTMHRSSMEFFNRGQSKMKAFITFVQLRSLTT